jgi:putative transposase
VNSEFVCQACGHQDNSDHNAGQVIAGRGVRLLLSGSCQRKEVKRCGIFRQKAVEVIGPVRSEITPVEVIVSRLVGNGQAQGTTNQETTATTS